MIRFRHLLYRSTVRDGSVSVLTDPESQDKDGTDSLSVLALTRLKWNPTEKNMTHPVTGDGITNQKYTHQIFTRFNFSPVRGNWYTPLIAVSTAVRNKVTMTVPKKATVENNSAARPSIQL